MTTRRRSRVLLLATAAGVLALLPACSDNDSTSNPQTAPNANTISVHGTGTVKVEPDVLDIVFAAEGNALTAKAAYDQMAAASEKIASTVKDAGVEKKDIQSSQIYLNPT
ncbi:MAG: SIMPL domain-containing protein, partial [Ilumatobacteraceae bacterium]